MARFGFCGPSYQSESPDVDPESCVNFYPESVESGWGKSQVALYSTPGCELFATLSGPSVRKLLVISNPTSTLERVFGISGPNFYELFEDGTFTLRNPLNPFPGSGIASVAASAAQILIIDGGQGFCFNLNTNSFQALKTYTTGAGDLASPYSIASGGQNYQVNDVVTPSSSSGGSGGQFTVSAISGEFGGAITLPGTTINAEGSGYVVGDIVTAFQPGGQNGQLQVTETTPSPGGQIIGFQINNGGTGYLVNDTISPQGAGGTGGTLTVTSTAIGGGQVETVDVNNDGAGYLVGDNITITGGNGNCLVQVTRTSKTGGIDIVAIQQVGSGYTTADNVATSGGSGSGFTANIVATAIGTVITGLVITAAGSGYSTTANCSTTTSGSGTGAVISITASSGTAGQVLALIIVNGGTLYTGAQAVATTGGTGTGLTLNLVCTPISSNAVTGINLTTPGSGYSPAQNQPMTGGSGTGLQMNYSTSSVSSGSGMISNPSMCVQIDGFFIVLQADSQQMQCSQPYDASTWDPTNVDIVSVFPENVVEIFSMYRQLWVGGSRHTQVYYDSGNLFPFDPVQGAFIELGTGAPLASVVLNNTRMWLGEDFRGQRMAWQANGYTPQRISNHAVEYRWQNYETFSDAIGYAWQYHGHAFWRIYFPTAGETWEYDAATTSWHECQSLNAALGTQGPHLSQCHVFAWGQHLIGDWNSGNVYVTGDGMYTDNGQYITRVRISPYIFREHQWIHHQEIELDLEVGLAPQPPLLDGMGNPRPAQLLLQWSDDQAHTWSNGRVGNCGLAGQFLTRVHFHQLGRSRGRVYKITCSDPIDWRFADAYLEATPGFATMERLAAQIGKMG